ncbi:amidohydrolase family protein [Variovorax sp. VNK109]|uniref:amidohydrolase family protein n=1 Tax=Variovorax sp. VNK109 TaxID=3400919 RepID=UPI003C0184E3
MASSKHGLSQGLLRAGYLLPSSASERTLANARVRFSADGILSIQEDADTSGANPERTLIMSPLANAHDHGRGLRTLDYGALDTAVEAWVPATYALPPVDPYLVAASAFARMVRSGIGSTVHCHLSNDIQSLLREARAVRRAADDVGIRVAFVVPLRDGTRQGYSAATSALAGLRPADADAIRAQLLKPSAPVTEQLALVEQIARECEGPLFQVQYGPVGLEWCSDALIEGIANASRASGRRVHMHFLESRYQREWADAAFARSPVGHLHSLGLLGERLTLAHGTWLRRDECEMLAASARSCPSTRVPTCACVRALRPCRTCTVPA